MGDENRERLECSSDLSRIGYVQRVWDQWMLQNPTYKLSKKQLLAQRSNIRKQKLVLQVEISKATARRSQDDRLVGDIITSEIGYRAQKTSPDRLNIREADMRL